MAEDTMSDRAHDRVYIDGCLDMFHHGHSGAIRQARQLGRHLVCGVHSDAEIAANKGIPVMSLAERVASAAGCKWVDDVSVGAPYVIDTAHLDACGCEVAVHGDDITTDAAGNDCYQEVKDAGRFVVCRRTPAISTTDLVGRMLLHTRDHHISARSSAAFDAASVALYAQYATGSDAVSPCTSVYRYDASTSTCSLLVAGTAPADGQEVVYADGGWDLFTAGHSEMLRSVKATANTGADGSDRGEKKHRFVVVGLHDDATVNAHKGYSYPIMNLRERALSALACRSIDAIVLGVPYDTTRAVLQQLPFGPTAVYHGPLPLPASGHGYEGVLDVLRIAPSHQFEGLNAAAIVQRIVARSAEYLERQRKKGVKADKEALLRAAELGQQQSAAPTS